MKQPSIYLRNQKKIVMNNLFITGTDTNAGKTALSSLLLSHLNESGKSVLPMKPAQSGCNNSIPDLDYALSLSGIKVSSEIKDLMSPACYQPACSGPILLQRWKINHLLFKI